jgi:hypothetical protein
MLPSRMLGASPPPAGSTQLSLGAAAGDPDLIRAEREALPKADTSRTKYGHEMHCICTRPLISYPLMVYFKKE